MNCGWNHQQDLMCCIVDVTMLLALSVYQIIINEKLPVTSDAVPLLGKSHHSYEANDITCIIL